MVSLIVTAEPVPLRIEPDGTARVGQTRVTLDTILLSYESGESAEEIAYHFPTVTLAQVHAILAWYLSHREEADKYMQERESLAQAIRAKWESRCSSSGLRERLLARKAARKPS